MESRNSSASPVTQVVSDYRDFDFMYESNVYGNGPPYMTPIREDQLKMDGLMDG